MLLYKAIIANYFLFINIIQFFVNKTIIVVYLFHFNIFSINLKFIYNNIVTWPSHMTRCIILSEQFYELNDLSSSQNITYLRSTIYTQYQTYTLYLWFWLTPNINLSILLISLMIWHWRAQMINHSL